MARNNAHMSVENSRQQAITLLPGARGVARFPFGPVLADFVEFASFGSTLFRTQPTKYISLRRVEFLDRDSSGAGFDATYKKWVNLNDELVKDRHYYTGLWVRWDASPAGLSKIREISVLVVGETD